MILSFGLKSNKSSRPKLFTAIFIISDSGTPNDLFCLFKKYSPASINTFFGTKPISSEPVTLIPFFVACSQVLSNTKCNGDTLISVKLYEICAILYSLINHPIPFTDLNIPGSLSGFPFLSLIIFPSSFPPSLLILPASLISNAIEFALLVEVVFRLTLYAIKKSLAPTAVTPDFLTVSLNLSGP